MKSCIHKLSLVRSINWSMRRSDLGRYTVV